MSNTIGWGKAAENNTIGYGDGKDNSTNGWGSAYENSWSGETLLEVLLTAPVNVSAPVVSGTASVGSVLTTTNGTWDNEPTSYTYQWKRNGSNILSATANTYTIVAADVSQSITCTVTATNDAGSASATSNTITPTWETDAQAFITAAAITDPTQQSAVNNLVIGMKADGLWSKMKAIYPFVGGTSSTHKFNLKNPLDTDAAFRLVFNGGVTHSANGITGNGTNGFADTKLNEQNILGLNNKHISLYVRNDVTTNNVTQMGIFTNASSRFILNFNNSINYSNLGSSGQISHSLIYPVKGFVCMSRTNSSDCVYFQNNTTPVTKTSSSASNNNNFYVLALNSSNTASQYCSDNIAFSSIGDGLTNTDYANLNNRVTTFQTALNRNI